MKHLLRLLVICSLWTGLATAQTAVVKRNVNLRSDASTDSDVIAQVELFLKCKDINVPSQFKLDPKNPTPLGDYAFRGGGSALSLSLTPPGAGTKVLTLGSASAFLNGVPHAAVPPALPPNPPPLGPLGTWTLTAAQADIQKIAGSLQTVVSSGGNNYSHLNSDVLDDIFFVCHCSVTSIG